MRTKNEDFLIQGKRGGVKTMDPFIISGLVSTLGMILVGLLFIICWKRKTKVSYSPFLFGVLLWIISVALKAVWAIATNTQILNFLSSVLGTSSGNLMFWIYLGLLTGIFECGIVYLWVRYSKLREYNFNQATSFGIGFGAGEAIILGIIALISVLIAIFMPNVLPADALSTLNSQSLLTITIQTVAPLVERFCAVLVHAFAAVLIFASIKNKMPSFFWLAFVYKSSIDAIAAWGQLSFITSVYHLWTIEFIVIIYGIVGFYGIKWIKNRY